MDNDGDLDVFLAAWLKPETLSDDYQGWPPLYQLRNDRLFINDGSGTFSRRIFGTSNASTNTAAFADVDGDGDLDLALGNDGPNQVNGPVCPLSPLHHTCCHPMTRLPSLP